MHRRENLDANIYKVIDFINLYSKDHSDIGFIFQQYNLLPCLNALENIAIPLLAAGMKEARAYKECLKILEKIDIINHNTIDKKKKG
jgi:putative ABC transport system ATP-binding protein